MSDLRVTEEQCFYFGADRREYRIRRVRVIDDHRDHYEAILLLPDVNEEPEWLVPGDGPLDDSRSPIITHVDPAFATTH